MLTRPTREGGWRRLSEKSQGKHCPLSDSEVQTVTHTTDTQRRGLGRSPHGRLLRSSGQRRPRLKKTGLALARRGRPSRRPSGQQREASAGSAACGGGGGQRPVCPRQRTEEAKTDSSLGRSLCQATPTFKTCLETASTLDTLPRRQGKLGPKRMLIIKTPS